MRREGGGSGGITEDIAKKIDAPAPETDPDGGVAGWRDAGVGVAEDFLDCDEIGKATELLPAPAGTVRVRAEVQAGPDLLTAPRADRT